MLANHNAIAPSSGEGALGAKGGRTGREGVGSPSLERQRVRIQKNRTLRAVFSVVGSVERTELPAFTRRSDRHWEAAESCKFDRAA
jgi:hypothetical protein